jgi:hypothetical protein
MKKKFWNYFIYQKASVDPQKGLLREDVTNMTFKTNFGCNKKRKYLMPVVDKRILRERLQYFFYHFSLPSLSENNFLFCFPTIATLESADLGKAE